MPKLCKDCQHYCQSAPEWSNLDACAHPALKAKPDLVRGEEMPTYCSGARMSHSACGPEGLLWEKA
jgi:hypothetical protein